MTSLEFLDSETSSVPYESCVQRSDTISEAMMRSLPAPACGSDRGSSFFAGRMGRSAYWPDGLTVVAVLLLAYPLLFATFARDSWQGVLGSLFTGALIPLLIPLPVYVVSCHVRRLHDLGRSGWYVLLLLIPLVNIAALLWMLVASGSHGPNQYGSAPNSGKRIGRFLYCAGVVTTLPFAGIALLVIVGYGTKRFHDLGKSGWNVLLLLIPVVNVVVLLYMLLAPGTLGPNRFGADPVRRHRMGRRAYITDLALLCLANVAFSFVVGINLLLAVDDVDSRFVGPFIVWIWISPLLLLYGLSCHIKRFHDFGESGWSVSLLLIPLANIGFFLELLFRPGTQGANQYGPQPRRRRRPTPEPASRKSRADIEIELKEGKGAERCDDHRYAPPGYFDGTPPQQSKNTAATSLGVGVCECCGVTDIAMASLSRIDSGQWLCPGCLAAVHGEIALESTDRLGTLPAHVPSEQVPVLIRDSPHVPLG